jgi:aspartyl-tRNA(Asn)/glutamyl-tRNA(Gln) amidotransferase subunit A
MNIDIFSLTIEQAHKDLVSGVYSAKDLLQACLANINKSNNDIFAFIEVFEDAWDMAEKADEMISCGEATILTGIPISIKDNILYYGHVASASSKMLENYKAVYDSTAVENLKKSGAVIVGRTNMDEFAMGSSTETSALGKTKNPRNHDYVPGGSSGGAAASVAMGGCLAALGSDTAGSVRQPASFCGVVGFKPTYGSVSRHGLIAMGSSLDVIGVLAKTVSCSQYVFDCIKGQDEYDSTSISLEDVETKSIKTIGVPKDIFTMDGVSQEVKDNFNKALETVKSAGYEIVDIDMPHLKYALPVYYILMPAEVSTNLARFDGVRYGLSILGNSIEDSYKKTRGEGFGKEVKRRVLLGTYVLSHGYYDAYYNKAVQVRHVIKKEFDTVFSQVDVILTPTSPTAPFKFGFKQNPLELYASDIFTVPANIADIPAISIPHGLSDDNMALDIQVMAPYKADKSLLEFTVTLESLLQ